MKFRIHFNWPDGTEDSYIIEEPTIDEVRQSSVDWLASRGLSPETANPWSEEL